MHKRIQNLVSILKQNNLDAVLFNPSPSLSYLSGLHFHLSERPVVAVFGADEQNAIVLPELEAGKLEGMELALDVTTYGEDPALWPMQFAKGLQAFAGDGLRIGVEPTWLRFLELDLVQKAIPQAQIVDAGVALASLRMYKDEGELAKMRQAAVIAQNALLATLKQVREGMREVEIAGELLIQLLKAGNEGGLPFTPIVSISENAANPHAIPGERALKPGDLLLIDYGANYQGYQSDITRTFSCGELCEEFKTISKLVCQANEAARLGGKAGMQAGEIDKLARDVIEAGGYGEAFIHRTGHGLGMETHEAPYIFAGNPLVLQEGMVFTIEPGIYLPGKGGVRIEDDVVVTAQGLRSLTDLPRRVLPLSHYQS